MCIVLPVAHIPCTHTVSIWHHCIDAARSGTPCWNVCQHDRAVLSRKLCKECGGDRFFARRGGVAERGEGSPPPTRDGAGKGYEDDTDDSGYCSNSDIIAEEWEGTDEDDFDFDFPLSPRATVPPRRRKCGPRMEKKARSLNRKASWRPNLKQELSGKNGPATASIRHRESIDELIGEFRTCNWTLPGERRVSTSTTGKESEQKRRPSTLLHPSSPAEETFTFQTVTALPFPQVVHIRKPSDAQRRRLASKKPTPTTSASSSDNDDAPDTNTKTPHRKRSTLLHPSLPPTLLPPLAHHQTIISIPPRRARNRTPPPSPPTISPRRPSPSSLPRHNNYHHQTPPPANPTRRRPSILHSSLSDTDTDSDTDSEYKAPCKWTSSSFAAHAAEQAEEALLSRSARVARASRGRGRGCAWVAG